MNMVLYKEALDSYSVSESTTKKIMQNMLGFAKQPQSHLKRYILSSAVGCAAIVFSVMAVRFMNSLSPIPVNPIPDNSINYSTTQTKSNQVVATVSETKRTSSTFPTISQHQTTAETRTSTPTSPTRPSKASIPQDDIVWNPVCRGPSSTMYRDPNAVAQEFNLNKFVQYVGYNPFPEHLPEGYKYLGVDEQQLYFNPDGTPTDYCCAFGLSYYNGDKRITVTASRAKLHTHTSEVIYSDNPREVSLSKVNGITVLLREFAPSKTYSLDVTRSAEFQINGLNYYVYAVNDVSPDDFLEVITSLARIALENCR